MDDAILNEEQSLKHIPSVSRPATALDGLMEEISGRWSSRAIDAERSVSWEVLERLIEAARWAPSAMNGQPWRFMSFGPEDSHALEQARRVLKPGNAWAKNAPRLLFVMAKKNRGDTEKPNALAMYETGMAMGQMGIQAVREGLVFHQMAGIDRDHFRMLFSIPENLEVVVGVALAFPGSVATVPEERQELETAPRQRHMPKQIHAMNGDIPQ
ncbi:MAG: nitroreductase family protein [Spirochaetales bacterium]|nr:nitroreductase family protein [Spirochaetales bacterium]